MGKKGVSRSTDEAELERPPCETSRHSEGRPKAQGDGVLKEDSTEQWYKDAERLRTWLNSADQKGRMGDPYPMPDVSWGVLNKRHKKGGKENAKAVNYGEDDIGANNQKEEGERSTDNLPEIMAFIRPVLDASISKGIPKEQRSRTRSLLRYWIMYSVAFYIDIENFGANPTGTDDEKRKCIRRDCMVLVGFAIFVATVPCRTKRVHNSTAQSERPIGSVRSYYEHTNRRTPGAGLGVDFTRTLRSVTRGLRELYP